MKVARTLSYLALAGAVLFLLWAILRPGGSVGHTHQSATAAHRTAPARGMSATNDGIVDPVTRRRHDESLAGQFVAAAATGDTHRVAELLDSGVSPDIRDAHGYGALQQAAAADAVETVRLLLGAGAEVNDSDGVGWSALCWAAYMGAANVADMLLEAGADPNNEIEPGARPLDQLMGAWHLAQGGVERMPALRAPDRLTVARLLLRSGADPNEFSGTPPLEAALFTGDAELVSLFLEHGADLYTLPNPRVLQRFLEQPGPVGDLVRNAVATAGQESRGAMNTMKPGAAAFSSFVDALPIGTPS